MVGVRGKDGRVGVVEGRVSGGYTSGTGVLLLSQMCLAGKRIFLFSAYLIVWLSSIFLLFYFGLDFLVCFVVVFYFLGGVVFCFAVVSVFVGEASFQY